MKILNLKQHEPAGLLAGTTTMLLRRVEPQPALSPNGAWWHWPELGGVAHWRVDELPDSSAWMSERLFARAPFQVGQTVWCREAWSYHTPHGDCSGRVYAAAQYVVPESQRPKNQTWQPASRMPKWMSRLTLEIVSVAVVQVASLTDEQVYATGLFDRTWTHVDNNVHKILMHAWETVYGGGVWCWCFEVRKA